MRFSLQTSARSLILAAGDIFAFYAALVTALIIRYGASAFNTENFELHKDAFTFGLLLWLIIFYIGGLYERQILVRRVLDRRFFAMVGVGGLCLILLFYFIPSFGITPKITLLLFVGVYAVIGYCWRVLFSLATKAFFKRGGAIQVLLVGNSIAADEIATAISESQGIGYNLVRWLKEGLGEYANKDQLIADVKSRTIDLIVIPASLERDPDSVRLLYETALAGAQIISLPDFYERIFEKVSLSVLDETWLIRNVAYRRLRYQPFRRLLEFIFAVVVLIIVSPLLILTAFAVFSTSRGGVFYKQTRIGFDGVPFTLVKFRTMFSDKSINPDADSLSPVWSLGKLDLRVTPVGKFLRFTHIDELPQIFNILTGNMSFVGPRPERPEFTKELEKQIPYYQLRYLSTPGIAGWAQLHFRYGSSVEDAYQKLQYDIYYIKHRSIWLDMTIILKTIKRLFLTA